MNNNAYIIGIGAKARVGKDTLARMLKNLIEEKSDWTCQILRLADALKGDCESFLKEKCNMDVWTEDTVEKAKFRNILVNYGKIQRDRTAGTYWTNIVEKQIRKDLGLKEKLNIRDQIKSFYIIPDIRYCEYPDDEAFWLKQRMQGCLINVERIHHDGTLFPPVNDDEKENSKILRKIADYELVWNELQSHEINGEPSKEAHFAFEFIKNFFNIKDSY